MTVVESGDLPPASECSDGLDNDGDALTDYPADPGCESAADIAEAPNPAPPAPASKEDCAKGGYVNYGFKNQGACVASFGGKKG